MAGGVVRGPSCLEKRSERLWCDRLYVDLLPGSLGGGLFLRYAQVKGWEKRQFVVFGGVFGVTDE